MVWGKHGAGYVWCGDAWCTVHWGGAVDVLKKRKIVVFLSNLLEIYKHFSHAARQSFQTSSVLLLYTNVDYIEATTRECTSAPSWTYKQVSFQSGLATQLMLLLSSVARLRSQSAAATEDSFIDMYSSHGLNEAIEAPITLATATVSQ